MSKNNNNNDERNCDITELPTGEYPALDEGYADADGDAPGREPGPSERRGPRRTR